MLEESCENLKEEIIQKATMRLKQPYLRRAMHTEINLKNGQRAL